MTKWTGWAVTLLGAGTLALLVPAIGVTAGQDPPANQVAVAEIRLADSNGSCTVAQDSNGAKLATDVVEVSKSSKPWVRFSVINNCSSRVDVGIGNLRHRTQASASDPGEPNMGNRKETVKAGATASTLRIKVRRDAVEGLWDYDILVNGKKVDPGIKINP